MIIQPTGTIQLPNWTTVSGYTFGTVDDSDLVTLTDGVVTISGDLVVSSDITADTLTVSTIVATSIDIGTGELTCGSINRVAGTLTLEIGGTAEISITASSSTFGGNIIVPNAATIGAAGLYLTFDDAGNRLSITGGEVRSDNIIRALILRAYYSPQAEFDCRSFSTTTAFAPLVGLVKSHTNSIGIYVETITDDVLGQFSFQGITSGSSVAVGASIQGKQVGAAGANFVPAKLVFQTWSSTAANANLLVLSQDAKVKVNGTTQLGDGGTTNYLQVSATGVVSLVGSAKRILTLRAELDQAKTAGTGKPTQVSIGIFQGFSLPIHGADEELFFRENVPGRWDEASDIVFHVKVALSGAEDVGDKFQLRLSWEHAVEEEVVPVTSNDVDVETTVLAGRAAQYDEYEIEFTIDYNIDGAGNEIKMHELLGSRLIRIAATANEIAGEVIVLDWHTHYTVDKMFKAP